MEKKPETHLGVIESLSLGFRVAATRPWLLAISVLLDLFLWLGPRVSVGPLVNRFLSALEIPPEMPPELIDMVAFSQETLGQIGSEWNLLSLLSRGIVTVPSFMAPGGIRSLAASPFGAGGQVLALGTIGSAVGWAVVAALSGLLLGGLYLLLIATEVRLLPIAARPAVADETDDGEELISEPDRPFWARLGRTWLSFLLLGLLLVVVSLLIIVPISLLSGVLALVSPSFAIGATSLLSLATFTIVMWASFVLSFTGEAIVYDQSRPLLAMWQSAFVVWRNLWPTMGLMLISYVIGAGFTFIWDRLASWIPAVGSGELQATTWGTIVGILGTAFMGVGLSAAALIYYANRRLVISAMPRIRVPGRPPPE